MNFMFCLNKICHDQRQTFKDEEAFAKISERNLTSQSRRRVIVRRYLQRVCPGLISGADQRVKKIREESDRFVMERKLSLRRVKTKDLKSLSGRLGLDGQIENEI